MTGPEKLKPCPFCKGTMEEKAKDYCHNEIVVKDVRCWLCRDCGRSILPIESEKKIDEGYQRDG